MRQIDRVAVLGSNSFTGAHFVAYLLQNTDCHVVGFSRSPEVSRVFAPYPSDSGRFRFIQADVNSDFDRVSQELDAFAPQAVVNFAAQGEVRNSWRWPLQWYQTNTMAVVKLAEFLKDKAYLQAYLTPSTPEVYGATGREAVVENHNYRPSTPYGVSKLAGDLHLLALHRRQGFPVLLTRSANLFGAHQQLYRIIPRTTIFLKQGRKLPLHGGGKAMRAFIHARDVASGTWLALTRGAAGEVYHLAPQGELISIAQVVAQVCQMLGRSFEDSVEMQEENFGQDDSFSLDSGKARRELGWESRVGFADGVGETVRWIEDEWETIRNLPCDYEHKA